MDGVNLCPMLFVAIVAVGWCAFLLVRLLCRNCKEVYVDVGGYMYVR